MHGYRKFEGGESVYTIEYYSAMKRKEIFPFMTAWIGLEDIRLSEISQKGKDKYCMFSIFLWNLKIMK